MLRRKRTTLTQKILKGAGIAAGSAGAAALGWVGYSALAVNHRRRLPSALDAPINYFRTLEAGMLAYYVDRTGTAAPLVLLHGINAAASSYEMRPLFERFRGSRPVFALDLPGFGYSDRERREYTPQLYTAAIIEFLASEVTERADVVALSLSGEFAAAAAVARPDRFRSLTVISPTGFSARGDRRAMGAAYGAMSFPFWSQAFFDGLVTRASLHRSLKKNFEGRVDHGLLQYAYETAHRPNARFAPLHFITGRLFTPGVLERVYASVNVPALALYDRDPYVSFERIDELARSNPNWRVERVPGTRGLPHFEQFEATAGALGRFWEGVQAGAPQPAAIPAS